jgi:VWFA-related protein
MSRRSLPFSLLVSSLLLAAAAAQTEPQGPVTTLKASSRLVVVDVVVTDYKGNPIHNLKQSDFTLLEKGQPQTISHFEEHASLAGAPQKIASMPKLEPGTFTNYSPAPVDGALNILLLDSLNTPMQDQTVVRDQIMKYLKTARPGTRMAIFGLNQRLHLLQGFTSDPELLRQVVEGKKNLPQASALMDHPVSGDTIGQDSLTDTMSDMLGNSPGAAAVIANMQQFEAQQAAFQTMLRTEYTLDALNQLGRYLSGLPGRKNLIWFSGSFPIDILPDGDLSDPFAIAATFEDEFRETTNLLARSQVAVYPIDARGLFVNPVYSASNAGAKYAHNPQAFGTDQTRFFNKTANEHSTMMEMAGDTGGKAFVNTNGLKEAVDKAVDAGANYYTLTYQPTNKNWNGDYRKIQVKMGAPGYTLAYRQGYYADDPDAPPTKKNANTAAATATTTFNPMAVAMGWGGPDPTEILFTATVLPATGAPEPTIPATVQLQPKVGGPYRRYVVAFSALGKDISAPATPDGGHHINVEFVTFVYNSDGALIATTGKQIAADINDAHYKAMLKSGVQYRQEISVPVKGEYFLRIGIHDLATDHVGAIEVPVDKVSRLKPLAAAASVPAETTTAAKP